MKKIKYLSCALLLLVLTAFTSMTQKKKVIFFGDSITQAAVKNDGYIVKIQELEKNEKIADKFEFAGEGIGGNKEYDHYLRMDNDEHRNNTDIIVFYIGIDTAVYNWS